MKCAYLLAALNVPAMVCAAVAVAADVPVDDADSAPAARGGRTSARAVSASIDEVIVTAQKREENLQDVPISVQAFDARALDDKGIANPIDLPQLTPGLQYNQAGGYSLIYIRGVGTDAYIPSADASVATYIDNVYYPFGHGLAGSFGAVERVEVLKGPQGTLFGRNSTGGAINVVMKQPGPIAETSITTSLAERDSYAAKLYSNIPLSQGFAISVAGVLETRDSYYKLADISPRRPLDEQKTQGVRVKLGWNPGENLSVVLTASYVDSHGAEQALFPATNVKPLGEITGVREQPDYVTSENFAGYLTNKTRVFAADVQYTLPWLDTRLLLSRHDVSAVGGVDFDGSNQPLVNIWAQNQGAESRSAEWQFISNEDSPFAEHVSWIAGLYYFSSEAGYDPLYAEVGSGLMSYLSNPDAGPLLGLTAPLVSLINQTPGLSGLLNDFNVNGLTLALDGIIDTRATAAFTQLTWQLSERWDLTLGGRYQRERRKLTQSGVNLVLDRETNPGGARVISFDLPRAKTANFSPRVVLSFKPVEDHMAYASYSAGFKSGTFNIINVFSAPDFVVPEKVVTYELGYKADFLDRSLRLNVALFQNDVKNIQVQTVSLTSGGVSAFNTAGGARIRGFDFDARWQPLPEVLPGLLLTAGGTVMDGEYTDYEEGVGYDEESGLYFGGDLLPARDFTGNTTVRTPRFSASGEISYSHGLDSGSLVLAADLYHNDGYETTAQNSAATREHSYQIVGARIGYDYAPWNLNVTVFGRNITDAKYHYAILDGDFMVARLLAPPSTYGVQLGWSF